MELFIINKRVLTHMLHCATVPITELICDISAKEKKRKVKHSSA